jgi:DNA topoisomerase-1
VKHQTSYASLEPGDDVLHVGLNRVITLLAEKALRGG